MNDITFHIIKVTCGSIEQLLSGEECTHAAREFPTVFSYHLDAEKHLLRYIGWKRRTTRTVIGYLIQEKHSDSPDWWVFRQWSYAPDGRPLANAYRDDSVGFDGRDSDTLPFRNGDYVIDFYFDEIALGVISSEPPTPEEVADRRKRAMSRWPHYFPIDASDDCYLVDLIDENHDHPSVAQVFPLPFSASDIPTETITALNWAKSK